MASKQIIKIVQKITYSFIVDGVGKPLSSEEAIELIKAQGFIKTELDSGENVNLEGTPFSYKPNVAVFYYGKRLNIKPATCAIFLLFLEDYRKGKTCLTTEEIINRLRQYSGTTANAVSARISEINTAVCGTSEVIKHHKNPYYYEFCPKLN